MDDPSITIGRFSPSPTGPLHFGSLIAATASYLCAKQKKQDKWLLRIEDVDKQREQKGAAKSIILALESYGFIWDDEISYQSQRDSHYQAALERLSDHIYPCSCTRKELNALIDQNASFSNIYPDICRDRINNPNATQYSTRVKTDDIDVCFSDLCQADLYCQNIHQEIGDFILKRSDGFYAYQLAVVVDDGLQGINQIVRGADLYDNTPRQIYLQRLLGLKQPDYLHFPMAVSSNGEKLSKHNFAPEISLKKKRATLINALEYLGQTPPHFSTFLTIEDCWRWAFEHWDSKKIPAVMTQTFNSDQL